MGHAFRRSPQRRPRRRPLVTPAAFAARGQTNGGSATSVTSDPSSSYASTVILMLLGSTPSVGASRVFAWAIVSGSSSSSSDTPPAQAAADGAAGPERPWASYASVFACRGCACRRPADGAISQQLLAGCRLRVFGRVLERVPPSRRSTDAPTWPLGIGATTHCPGALPK